MSKKSPASQMLRVPTPLVDVYQKLNQLHRKGAPVVDKLNQLIADLEAGIDSADSSVLADIHKRLETLEAAVNRLESADSSRTIQSDTSDSNMPIQTDSADSKQTQTPKSTPHTAPVSGVYETDSVKGLTQSSLCRRFGITPQNVSRDAANKGMTVQAFLEQLTGWAKRGRLWYPPLNE